MKIILVLDEDIKALQENESVSSLRYDDIYVDYLNKRDANKFLQSLTDDNKIKKMLIEKKDHPLFENKFSNDELNDIMDWIKSGKSLDEIKKTHDENKSSSDKP
jgi:Xaa-Pro aminopeptidase